MKYDPEAIEIYEVVLTNPRLRATLEQMAEENPVYKVALKEML
ncbi:MAG: hypothetical protein V3U19_02590 [Thermodesulfobacteriota bacterium]